MKKNSKTPILPAPHIFRANDIRGVFGQDFDLSFSETLGESLAILLKDTLKISAPKILLGHDARLTSPSLSQNLLSSLTKQGIDVAFIGLAPSPLCYFLLHHYDLSAAMIVTASHNPVSYNGFKIMIHKKFQCQEPIKNLKDICFSSVISSLPASKRKGHIFEIDPYAPYIKSLKREFSLQPFPFVVDAGNGALGPLAKRVFKDLGLSPWCLFCEPDGRFPNHHPDPTVEVNLKTLKKKISETESLFGVGFDGDGDRLGLVTRKGRFVFGDEFGILFLKDILKKKGTVIADVKCSDRFFKAVKNMGGKVIMARSGHSFARKELEKHQACMALEFSGHIFFNDRPKRGFDDALYNTLRLVELLNHNPDLETLLPPFNPFQTGELRLSASPQKIKRSLDNLKLYLKKEKIPYDETDGIRFSMKTAWALFRESQTQSSTVTLRLEASSREEFLHFKERISSLIDLPL